MVVAEEEEEARSDDGGGGISVSRAVYTVVLSTPW